MEKSFRAILHEILEEKETEPTPVAAFSPAPEMSFSWMGPRLAQAAPRPTYARATPPPENVITLESLSPALRFHADMLIALGAGELVDGLNARRLKKAHRRLAKRLHPDMGGDVARFQSLQQAYERLAKAIV